MFIKKGVSKVFDQLQANDCTGYQDSFLIVFALKLDTVVLFNKLSELEDKQGKYHTKSHEGKLDEKAASHAIAEYFEESAHHCLIRVWPLIVLCFPSKLEHISSLLDR